MQNILDLSLEELATEVADQGLPKFRLQQIWHWIYKKGVKSFDEMVNLPLTARSDFVSKFTLERPRIATAQTSTDGTQKWLLEFVDHQQAETVHIPEKNRGTLCISSQIGCTLTCSFCHTGTQTLVRNLSSGEIIGQVLLARDLFNDWSPLAERQHVSHIVMMGMGEPFYNYPNVKKALTTMMHPDGLAFSKRRITLSTSGVIPFIKKCAEELGVNLAISLHAVRDDIRNTLVPLNKKYPLRDLIDACRAYPELSGNHRWLTFEYVMLRGINDSAADARELVKLIRGIPAKVNLIPFNPWPGSGYECSPPQRIREFADIIQRAGYPSPVRTSRGQDILAACGQLKSTSQRPSKSKRQITLIDSGANNAGKIMTENDAVQAVPGGSSWQ